MPKLEITSGKSAGQSFELKQGEKNVVGNRRQAAVPLKDHSVAFDHAVIYFENGRWWV
jgi:hypothetical protein